MCRIQVIKFITCISNYPYFFDFLAINLFWNGLSRIRTYIKNLEGFCPDPLDDKPISTINTILLLVLNINK